MNCTLILVDFNSMEATLSYIGRCQQAFPVTHAVIVENGAQDKNPDILRAALGEGILLTVAGKTAIRFRTRGLDVVYCHSGGNVGYARGNNLGAIIAREMWKDPYYLISNNDLYFPEKLELSTFEALFDADPQIGVIGPSVVTPESEQQSPRVLQSAYQKLILSTWIHAAGVLLPAATHRRLMNKYMFDTCTDAITGPCDWVSGCFFIARADAFHKAGMFDESTFLYGEEMILSKRLEAINSRAWFCKEVEVVHCHAQTTRSVLSEMKMQEITFDSLWHFYKTYTNTSAVLLTLAKWNFALYKALFYSWQKVKKLIRRT